MPVEHYQIYATDSLIKRNRIGRIAVLTIFVASTFILPVIGWVISMDWFGYGKLGLFIGVIAQIIFLSKTLDRFFVKVNALRAFVTVDLLRTFLSGKDEDQGDARAYITYGPGFHLSYPWESRDSSYNISLEEASEDFSVSIQTEKGFVSVEGSLRMRPDICRAIPFLSGVAVMADDITDIVKSFLIELISRNDESLLQILRSVDKLNEELNKKFGFGSENDPDSKVSSFERRFGVSIGDVTIAKLLPSEEVQKTMSGISEAEIIADGAAQILGYTSVRGARQAIRRGTLTEEDLSRARDRFMAASDNITMDLNANEYTIKFEGLDQEIIEALTKAAPALLNLTQRKPSRKGNKND